MSSSVLCARCGEQVRVPGSAAGKRVRCPKCGERFVARFDGARAGSSEAGAPRKAARSRRPRHSGGEGIRLVHLLGLALLPLGLPLVPLSLSLFARLPQMPGVGIAGVLTGCLVVACVSLAFVTEISLGGGTIEVSPRARAVASLGLTAFTYVGMVSLALHVGGFW